MINNKLFVAIGALVLVGLTMSTASECDGCRGNELIENMVHLEESTKCWFSTDNRELLPIVKLAVMTGVSGVLEVLYASTNIRSSLRCKKIIPRQICLSTDKAVMAECMMDNMKAVALGYREVEECNGKVLDDAKLDLVLKVVAGSIVGWREIHSEC